MNKVSIHMKQNHAFRNSWCMSMVIVPVIGILCVFTGCMQNNAHSSENDIAPKPFVVWAHSDIQPRSENEKNNYIIALKDIRDNMAPPDMALYSDKGKYL